MAEVNKSKLTPFQQEMVATAKKIREFSLACEANIVSSLWKDPELYYTYDNLELKDFMNNMWRVYWQIGQDIILSEGKKTLDEITVGLYLEKHPKLSAQYDDLGGLSKITEATMFVKIENIDGYIQELKKWNVILELTRKGYQVSDRLAELIDMDISEIYDEYEATLNHIFANVDREDKTYDISDGIYELIDKLDEGLAVGLPYHNLPIVSKETGGMLEGNITLIGGISGAGKSTFVRNAIFPEIIAKDESILVLINEEGKDKWQREYLVWVANNIIGEETHKYEVRDGNYSSEFKQRLIKAADWIVSHKDKIRLIPMGSFTSSKAIKYIKKYSHLGFKYFVLDTFKADNDSNSSVSANQWLDMQQAMVKIYNAVKPEAKNVHLACTFQLSKNSSKQRYYTQDNVGVAKNIIDVASTCIMIRPAFDDEYENGNSELYCYRLEGKYGKTKIPFSMTKDKNYQIVFIVKNREGATNDKQIVIEHNLSTNVLKESGLTSVPMDF